MHARALRLAGARAHVLPESYSLVVLCTLNTGPSHFHQLAASSAGLTHTMTCIIHATKKLPSAWDFFPTGIKGSGPICVNRNRIWSIFRTCQGFGHWDDSIARTSVPCSTVGWTSNTTSHCSCRRHSCWRLSHTGEFPLPTAAPCTATACCLHTRCWA